MQNDNKTQESLLITKTQEINTLALNLSEKTAEITDLLQEIECFKAKTSELTQKISQVPTNSCSKQEFDELQLINSRLSQELFECNKKLCIKTEENENLSKNLENKLYTIKNYENIFSTFNEKFLKLEENGSISSEKLIPLPIIAKKTENLESLTEENNFAKSEILRLTFENKKLRKKLLKIEKELDLQITQKLYLDQEVTDLKYELQNIRPECTTLETWFIQAAQQFCIEENIETIEDFRKIFEEYQDCKQNIDELKAKNEELSREAQKNKEKLRKIEEECKILQRQLQNKRFSSVLLDENMIEQITQSEKYQLSLALNQCNEENRILKEDLLAANKNFKDLEVDYDKKSKACAELSADKKE